MKGFLIGLVVAGGLGVAAAFVYPVLSVDTAGGWSSSPPIHLKD